MLILATDMARHSEIVERFKSKLDTFDFHNDDYVSSVSTTSSPGLSLAVILNTERAGCGEILKTRNPNRDQVEINDCD